MSSPLAGANKRPAMAPAAIPANNPNTTFTTSEWTDYGMNYATGLGSFLAANEPEKIELAFAIYPNPIDNVLNVKNNFSQNMKTISIIDLRGRIMLNAIYDGNEINVSSLQKGVYIAIITTDKETISQKIIKK